MKKYVKPSLLIESIEVKENIAAEDMSSVKPGDNWWDLVN